MASLWTGLLFLHGHIADPALARRLDAAEAPPPPRGRRHRPKAGPAARNPAAPAGDAPLAAALPAPARSR